VAVDFNASISSLKSFILEKSVSEIFLRVASKISQFLIESKSKSKKVSNCA